MGSKNNFFIESNVGTALWTSELVHVASSASRKNKCRRSILDSFILALAVSNIALHLIKEENLERVRIGLLIGFTALLLSIRDQRESCIYYVFEVHHEFMIYLG